VLTHAMRFGQTTASLLIDKLHASSRHNSLARALQEYGRLLRTIYLCRYVADEELRRRVRRQLNKGESLPPCAATCSSPNRAMSGAGASTTKSIRPSA